MGNNREFSQEAEKKYKSRKIKIERKKYVKTRGKKEEVKKEEKKQEKITVALQWTEATDETFRSFANGIRNAAGGTQVSLADLIVLAGGVGVEQAAKKAGVRVYTTEYIEETIAAKKRTSALGPKRYAREQLEKFKNDPWTFTPGAYNAQTSSHFDELTRVRQLVYAQEYPCDIDVAAQELLNDKMPPDLVTLFTASEAARAAVLPAARRCWTEPIRTSPFSTATPNSAMKPTPAEMLNGRSRSHSHRKIAPSLACSAHGISPSASAMICCARRDLAR